MKWELENGLSLRLPSMEDADEIFSLVDANRDYLREWMPWLDSTKSVDDSRKFLEAQERGRRQGRALTMLVLSHDEIIGVLSLNEIDLINRLSKIGYWLCQSRQGQGIMRKSVKALCDYAFEHLSLNRLEIRCATENLRSQKVARSLGFRKEATLRDREWLYDHFVDHVIFAMHSYEWSSELKDS